MNVKSGIYSNIFGFTVEVLVLFDELHGVIHATDVFLETFETIFMIWVCYHFWRTPVECCLLNRFQYDGG